MSEPSVFLTVVEAYDGWSGFYDAYDNPMVFGAGQVVEHVAQHAAGRVVVELGCGTGRPRDFHGPIPEKALERGLDMPLLVEFASLS